MDKLFKYFLYFIGISIALAFLPFTIGGILGWLTFKKVSNKRIKYGLLSLVSILTLFFGSAWVVALNSSGKQPSVNPTPTYYPTPTVNLTPTPPPTPTPTLISTPTEIPKKELYKVTKIIDGDTINVEINGKNETIRLIGIDSPETVDPRKPVQCFGKEASDKAKLILSGKSVSLEADFTQGERDKYNRLLRYIFLEDGTNFNKLMINEGYAHEYTYQSNPYKYQEDFKNAEKTARETKKGLWADDACITPTPIPTKQSTPAIQPTQSSSTTTGDGSYTCNCSKTCTQISSCEEAYFQLNQCGCKARDGDSDGVPCESLCR